jgi:hypothetical protein
MITAALARPATLLAALLFTAATLGAQTARPTTAIKTTPKETTMQAELEMMNAESAFRSTVDAFLASATAGDAARVEGMISPNLRAQAGAEAVAQVVRAQVIPFFADFEKRGGTTITQTTDQFGSQGFTYYTYAIPAGGQPKPFVLYMVREAGRIVVANVLVNRLVEGRHP